MNKKLLLLLFILLASFAFADEAAVETQSDEVAVEQSVETSEIKEIIIEESSLIEKATASSLTAFENCKNYMGLSEFNNELMQTIFIDVEAKRIKSIDRGEKDKKSFSRELNSRIKNMLTDDEYVKYKEFLKAQKKALKEAKKEAKK